VTYSLPRTRASSVQPSTSTHAEVCALLGCLGSQAWLRERDRPGTIFGEIVLPLQGGGATLKIWGIGTLYRVREGDVVACGIAGCERRASYDGIVQAMRDLHASGRFIKRRVRKATP
jgi:hypothetical protein